MNPREKIRLSNLNFFYGKKPILRDICLTVYPGEITAICGPSGSGKSTLLTVFNALWKDDEHARVHGTACLSLDGQHCNLLHPEITLETLRRRVGMVFQTPNPLPMSIQANVAFPLKLAGEKMSPQVAGQVENVLRRVHLWEEVKDRLHHDARQLSGGQQQRLCMARSLILEPDVLLLDEPTSSLDPEASQHIEALMVELKPLCTQILISHDPLQVQRIADRHHFLHQGRLVTQPH
ncbi:MAG: phosphate ABC transporter ATP-binding protein [Desulfuromonas sp.]|nr:MAG: phosphate ABC transporter ATP-binding protein [Desulfuromonas sp.]